MNTKCLMKAKTEDASQETVSSKPNKSIKLADTPPDEMAQNMEVSESMTTNKKVIDQIGQLTRNLHDSLRELGYDKRLQAIASEVPEAQDKLSYIATKTEQAAERTLNATEIAMPIQEKISADAIHLSEQWKQAFETHQTNPDTEKFKLLLIDTLQYLDKIPEQTSATNTQLMEIMMAQDFQDLTGQVIKKVTNMVQSLEKDLIDLLLANVPAKKNIIVADEGLLNGPVTNPEKRNDVVCNQDQVDDLLASLGF
ncbi:MAG: protein phosphatase CheZ [Nitrosomonas sp.]|nr:protein phosphatase CheZ [Nitrosomonas sp.]